MRKSCFVAIVALCMAFAVQAGPVGMKGGERLADRDRSEHTLRMRVFHQVWTAVRDSYYDKELKGLDWGKVRSDYRADALSADTEREFYGILNQMLGELHDGHTMAETPTEMNRERRQQRLGLGITSEIIENRIVLTRVAKGSAADQAGVQPGWILTHFNGEPVDVTRMRRPVIGSGEHVRFRFLDPSNQEREFDLEARPFRDGMDLRVRRYEQGLLYVKIDSFERGLAKWFEQVINANRDAEACIIDLRGNPGGFFNEMRECLKVLYADRAVLGESVERNGRRIPLQVPGIGSEAFTGRVIVLIDRRSYSAAEVFAAAIRDSKRGELVGRTSGGIALLALHKKLADGGEVSVSFRDYLRTNGERIEGRGVRPNIAVSKRLDDVRRNVDRDLQEALMTAVGQ